MITYPVRQTGIIELNIRVFGPGENNADKAEVVRALVINHGLDLVPTDSGEYRDWKVAIPNDQAIEVLADLDAISRDRPDIWGFCSFLCEDALQEDLLRRNAVPEENFDVDAHMGGQEYASERVNPKGDEHTFLVVVKVKRNTGELAKDPFLPDVEEAVYGITSALENGNNVTDPYLYDTSDITVYRSLPDLIADSLKGEVQL